MYSVYKRQRILHYERTGHKAPTICRMLRGNEEHREKTRLAQQHCGKRMASDTTIYSFKSPAGAQLCLSFHSPPKRLNRHIIHRRTVSIVLFTHQNVPLVFRPNYSRIVLRTVAQYDRSFPYNGRERSVLPAFSKNETLTLYCHILYGRTGSSCGHGCYS